MYVQSNGTHAFCQRFRILYRRQKLTCSDLLIKRTGAFQLYDINNDGLITYDEMLKIVQSIYDMTGEMVKLPPDEDTAEKVRFCRREN